MIDFNAYFDGNVIVPEQKVDLPRNGVTPGRTHAAKIRPYVTAARRVAKQPHMLKSDGRNQSGCQSNTRRRGPSS
jgi:hypothetical protein